MIVQYLPKEYSFAFMREGPADSDYMRTEYRSIYPLQAAHLFINRNQPKSVGNVKREALQVNKEFNEYITGESSTFNVSYIYIRGVLYL